MKVVFDAIDHFHPNFDESVPNPMNHKRHEEVSSINAHSISSMV